MKKTLIPVILFLVVLAACSPSVTEPVTTVRPGTEESAPTETTAAHFGYGDGHDGPLHWGDLDIEGNVCGTGQSQSPIDISKPNGKDLVNVAFHYQPSIVKIFNNGHTVQVDFGSGGYIELDGNRYKVAQIHYHAPGEHQVDGKSYAAEFHIVHKDEKDESRLAVIGLLLKEGAANTAFDPFINNAPNAPTTTKEEDKKEIDAMINAADLLPSVQTTYRYSGSLTTPPCTESVQWLVMTTPVEVSAEQLRVLEELFEEGNNRPVQPLNDHREVEEDTTP